MAYLLLFLTVLFWAGNFVLARGVHDIIPPITLSFWRWGLASLIFLPFSIRSLADRRKVIRAHWKLLSVFSILSVSSYNTFIYIALQSTTAINTALVQSFIPVLIVFLSWVMFRERISSRQGLGVLLSFFGLLWILSHGKPSVLWALQFSTGDLWAVSACISWAVYSVLLRRRPQGVNPAAFLEILMILGTVFLVPFFLWEVATKPAMPLSAATFGSILYVAVFPSVLSYFFWNKAVSMVGANRSGIFIHLMPVFSIMLAFIFLGERLDFYHLIGILLIFSGIVLTTMGRQKAGSSAPIESKLN